MMMYGNIYDNIIIYEKNTCHNICSYMMSDIIVYDLIISPQMPDITVLHIYIVIHTHLSTASAFCHYDELTVETL